MNSFDGSYTPSLLYIDNAIILTFSSFVALLRFPMSRKLLACSCVVSFFALYVLYSCRSCVLVLGLGCCWSFSLSFSMFVLFSGIVVFCGSGLFCSGWNLLLVTWDGEARNSSCSCVVGIGYVSGTLVGSGNDCVSGIMCDSSVDVLVGLVFGCCVDSFCWALSFQFVVFSVAFFICCMWLV